jgi:hypothetical protein
VHADHRVEDAHRATSRTGVQLRARSMPLFVGRKRAIFTLSAPLAQLAGQTRAVAGRPPRRRTPGRPAFSRISS